MSNTGDFKVKSGKVEGISKALLKHYKEKYKKGSRVRLMAMNDPYSRLKPGDIGTVDCVDDLGTIHIFWDCGSTLGVVYGEDSCEIVEVKK